MYALEEADIIQRGAEVRVVLTRTHSMAGIRVCGRYKKNDCYDTGRVIIHDTAWPKQISMLEGDIDIDFT